MPAKVNGEKTVMPLIRAEQIMSKPVFYLRTSDTVRQAASLLLDKGISGVPVLDHFEKPVGVITKTDIVRYEREYVSMSIADETRRIMRARGTLEMVAESRGFHRESEEDYVLKWMTPKIYRVGRSAPLAVITREMVKKRVHRLFVTDEKTGKIFGVITTFDLLKFFSRVLLTDAGKREKNCLQLR
ncbi:MAG: CBS domain-containing protein [Elusimicrobia bacterium]|nr:CBS domain-containing protein [Elusimicrobiota bacterium]